MTRIDVSSRTITRALSTPAGETCLFALANEIEPGGYVYMAFGHIIGRRGFAYALSGALVKVGE